MPDIGESWVVIYFTGTGNSRYLAKLAAQKMDDSLVSANALIKENKTGDFYSDSPYVFVCPTYSWQIPQILKNSLTAAVFPAILDAILLWIARMILAMLQKPLRQLCKRKGFQYRGVREIVMPENYIAVFSAPSEAEEKKIISAAEKSWRKRFKLSAAGIFFGKKDHIDG